VGVTLLFGRFAGLSVPNQESMLHAKIGRDILATRTWPTTDSYSFTAYGNDCIAFEWLGDLAMASAERLDGLGGLMALQLVLAAALVLLLYRYAWQRCANPKAAFLACMPMVPLLAPFLYLRAQLIGILLLLITLICLESFRHGHSRVLWVLPVVFLLWVNTHATFVFGLLALGIYWASGLTSFRAGGLRAEPWTARQRRDLLLVALLSVLALTATPYGTRLAAFPLDMLRVPVGVAAIGEYQPLGAVPILLKLFLALLLLFMVALLVVRPEYRLEEVALLLLGIYAGFLHRRFLLLFLAVFAPMLAALLARWLPNYEAAKDRHLLLNAVLILLACLGIAKAGLSPQELQAAVAGAYPEGAVHYLMGHPAPEPMFNEDSWGNYLIWRLDGKHKVFVDTRTGLYEEAGVFQDFVRIMQVDSDTQTLLRKYGIESCLVGRGIPFATLLAVLPDWEQVYQDDLAVIFVRKTAHTPATP
jgi:hypothetical protein